MHSRHYYRTYSYIAMALIFTFLPVTTARAMENNNPFKFDEFKKEYSKSAVLIGTKKDGQQVGQLDRRQSICGSIFEKISNIKRKMSEGLASRKPKNDGRKMSVFNVPISYKVSSKKNSFFKTLKKHTKCDLDQDDMEDWFENFPIFAVIDLLEHGSIKIDEAKKIISILINDHNINLEKDGFTALETTINVHLFIYLIDNNAMGDLAYVKVVRFFNDNSLNFHETIALLNEIYEKKLGMIKAMDNGGKAAIHYVNDTDIFAVFSGFDIGSRDTQILTRDGKSLLGILLEQNNLNKTLINFIMNRQEDTSLEDREQLTDEDFKKPNLKKSKSELKGLKSVESIMEGIPWYKIENKDLKNFIEKNGEKEIVEVSDEILLIKKITSSQLRDFFYK